MCLAPLMHAWAHSEAQQRKCRVPNRIGEVLVRYTQKHAVWIEHTDWGNALEGGVSVSPGRSPGPPSGDSSLLLPLLPLPLLALEPPLEPPLPPLEPLELVLLLHAGTSAKQVSPA